MEEPVTIVDRDVLKVLSADTRMDILKELSQGSRTPSDLSKKLGKSNATIVEHLEVLVKSGLVKKIEQPGKKWIFYTLTDRGIGIISSKSRRLVIILVTSFFALAGGIASMSLYLVQTSPLELVARTQTIANPSATIPIISTSPTFLYAAMILFVVGVVGIVFYVVKKRSMV